MIRTCYKPICFASILIIFSCERPTAPVHYNPYDPNYEFGDPIPSPATNLIISHVSSQGVKVKWQDNSTVEEGFIVERAVDNGGFVVIDTVGPNVTSFNDSRLDTTLTYQYRVHAYTGNKTSSFSERRGINHELVSEAIVALTEHSKEVISVAFSPDGQFFTSSGVDEIINTWEVELLLGMDLLDPFLTLSEDVGSVNSIVFGPDGEMLATGNTAGAMRLWSVQDGSLIRSFTGYTTSINSVAFSPDGEILASGSADSSVKIWLVEDGSLISTLKGHKSAVNSVAFSPDGTVLASASGDSTTKLWLVEDGSLIRTLSGHKGGVNSIAFAPGGEILLSGSDDSTIKLWLVEDGSVIQTLEGHTGSVNSIAIDANGKHLASGGSDFAIKLWLVASGDLLDSLTILGPVNVANFSAVGRYLATGTGYPDNRVRIWSISYKWVMVP